MKRFSQRAGYSTMAEVNVTPLLDLAFVLLIIFIITTPLIEQGIELSLPTASSTQAEVNPSAVRTISIDKYGVIYFDNRRVTLAELDRELLQWRQAQPDAAAVVRADRDLRYQQLLDVFDALQRAGVSRMGLVNNPQHEGGAR